MVHAIGLRHCWAAWHFFGGACSKNDPRERGEITTITTITAITAITITITITITIIIITIIMAIIIRRHHPTM